MNTINNNRLAAALQLAICVYAGGRYHRRGVRPALFWRGCHTDRAQALYRYFVERCAGGVVRKPDFAADMQVELVNDGPVTFWLEV